MDEKVKCEIENKKEKKKKKTHISTILDPLHQKKRFNI